MRQRGPGRPRKKKSIETLSVWALIDRFGGVYNVARACGVEKNTVYQWVKRGHIPYRAAVSLAELDMPDALHSYPLRRYIPRRQRAPDGAGAASPTDSAPSS